MLFNYSRTFKYQSDTLQNYWNRFTALERIRSWRTVSLRDLYDSDFLHFISDIFFQTNNTHHFTDACYWGISRPWQQTWLNTFHLDTVRGIPCTHTHTHHDSPALLRRKNIWEEYLNRIGCFKAEPHAASCGFCNGLTPHTTYKRYAHESRKADIPASLYCARIHTR